MKKEKTASEMLDVKIAGYEAIIEAFIDTCKEGDMELLAKGIDLVYQEFKKI